MHHAHKAEPTGGTGCSSKFTTSERNSAKPLSPLGVSIDASPLNSDPALFRLAANAFGSKTNKPSLFTGRGAKLSGAGFSSANA